MKTARVMQGVRPDRIPFDELFEGAEPVVLRGLASDWPLVKAGPDGIMDTLAAGYDGKPVIVYEGEASMHGRYAYNDDLSGFNYRAERRNLNEVFERINALDASSPQSYFYMNSIVFDQSFPGLAEDNSLEFDHPVFETSARVAKIWIGNQSTASAHFDIPKNIACCVCGGRRFTLFPPDQVHNLYPGPLSPTPGGQVVTLTNPKDPDFDRFPRLEKALDSAIVADLQPGDALYYPSLWWHEVDALDGFNVMVNYWWVDSPRYMGDPTDVLMHAMLGLRDRPAAEKKAWRELFDYYIFGDAGVPREHLPEAVQGALADMSESNARRIRAAVSQSLNR